MTKQSGRGLRPLICHKKGSDPSSSHPARFACIRDRLLDLRHASRLDHYDATFAVLGRRIEVSLAAG